MWYKSKTFWLNLIAIVVMVLQYLENWPTNPTSWIIWESLAVVVLNAIANMIQGQVLSKVKAKLAMAEAKLIKK